MLAEISWRWGAGAVLGWVTLPLLVWLARHSRHSPPAAYFRALVSALAIAAALAFAPALRGALGTNVELPLSLAQQRWGSTSSITLLADWVSPILGSRAAPWPSMPLARGLSLIGGLWLASLVTGAALSLASHWRLGYAYGSARAASARVLRRAADVATELGICPPAIRVADDVAAAFTFGAFTPIVVLGRSAESASDVELDFILRHELTHVLRGDTRKAFGIELAQRCFIGHPCLGGLKAEIRFAREAAVDEVASRAEPLEYARFLLGLADRFRSLRAPQTSQVSMADTALERRIEMLMSRREPQRSRLGAAWLGLSGLVLGALVLVAPSSFGQGGDAGDPEKTRVDGNLSVQQVEQVLFGAQGPLLDCYGRLPAPRANLKVRLVFNISTDGKVASGGRVYAAEHPELERCFEAALQTYLFPRPSTGTVHVDMPTELSPPLDERNARAEAQQGVSQRLAPEVIRKVVRDHFPGFRACYEALGQPLPTGHAKLKFTIARDGRVSDGEVQSKEYPALGKCLDLVMRSMRFPPPQDGIVTVEYPIQFAPGEPEGAKPAP